MSLYRLGYFFREAFKNILHSPVLTTISILTVAVSLILVGFFGGLLFAAGDLIDTVAQDVKISAYLEPDLPQERVDALIEQLKAEDGVESVHFVTLAEDRERNAALLSEELRAGLDEASIPAAPTLEIILERDRRLRRDLEVIAEKVKNFQGVEGVNEVEVGLDKIRLGLAFINVFETLAWVICVVLVIAAVFFVFSTVKMAVHGRADEIEILRLVGATGRFIRVPFYIEGLFQGLMGSLIAFTVVVWVHARLDTYIQEENLLEIEVNLLPVPMILWFFIGGTLLGLLGSVFSVGRYLRG